MKNLYKYLIIAALVGLDQFSKLSIISYFHNNISLMLESERFIRILPFLNVTYQWNTGVSFGMFAENIYSNKIFLVISSLICLYFIMILETAENSLKKLSCILIIAGAIGNIIDRIMHKAVFDFIDVHYNHLHFATFNIADALISVGAIIFLIYEFFGDKNEKA